MLKRKIEHNTDVLVIGGGIAALFAAIAARENGAQVTLVSKSTAGMGGECIMAGGIFLGFQEGDDLEAWIREAISISDGMDDPLLVGKCILIGQKLLWLMDQWGISWEKSQEKLVTKAGLGMQYMRNAMFHDSHQLMWTLRGKALALGVKIFDRTMMVDFLTSDGNMPTEHGVVGAVGFHIRKLENYIFKAQKVILATGAWGMNQYQPMDITGDGEAMAFRMGANMRSMEQLGFTLAPKVIPSLPGMHVLTGHGARFINAKKERFMEKYRPDLRERSPRNVLVQAAAREIKEGRGPIYLDCTHISPEDLTRIERIIPTTVQGLSLAGISLREHAVEYMPSLYGNGPMGGVMIDENAATNIKNLYCAGSVTDRMYAGIPGLTGASATGYIAGKNASQEIKNDLPPEIPQDVIDEQVHGIIEMIHVFVTPHASRGHNSLNTCAIYNHLQDIVLHKIGILKEPTLLKEAIRVVSKIKDKLPYIKAEDAHELMNALELKNILQIAELIAEASLERRESRYMHFREDYPKRDDQNWSYGLTCILNQNRIKFSKVPFCTIQDAMKKLEKGSVFD